jgi:hypothetical protein
MSAKWDLVRDIAYVLIPLGGFVLATPILMSVLPWELETGEYHGEFWAIGLAAALGVVGAPGYLYILFRSASIDASAVGLRRWLVVSLAFAGIASIIAIPFTVILAWPLAIFPVATLSCCIELAVRCTRAWRRAA